MSAALAGLSVKRAGLVPQDIEIDVLLIDPFIAVDAVLFGIIPHGVIPPVEERMDFRLINRIPKITARVLLHHPARHVIDFAVPLERKEHEKQARLMIIEFVDPSVQVRLDRKHIFCPPARRRNQEKENQEDDDADGLPDVHAGHTISVEATTKRIVSRVNDGFNHLTACCSPKDLSIIPLYDNRMKRASLHTLGCRLNQAETAVLESRLRRDGYRVVEFGEPTDLLVVNTCSVTEEAERTCRYVVRKTLRHSPDAFVAVTGCYAQTGVHELRSIPGIDLIVGNQFKWDLPSFLPSPEALKKQARADVLHTRTIDREDFVLPAFGEPDSTRPLLKIQDGCNVMCSFCLIPFARGHERSRLVEDVIREATLLVKGGYREVVLTGVNIGHYRQGSVDLVGLIERLETIARLERIRISSIEPTTITDALLNRMATSSKLCPYLHVPLQSGDDEILDAMNRPYNVKEFIDLIERAVSLVPGLGLGTDLMVGFPGESEAAFANTLRIAEILPLSYFHIFTYSPRPGTAATKLPHPVSVRVARERAQRMAELARRKRLIFAEQYIGTITPVLFESGKIDGFRVGTTANFLKVAVASDVDLTNRLRQVLITGVSDRWAVGQLTEEQRKVRTVPLL